MQFLVKSYCHTPWLPTLLTTVLLLPTLALPLSLGRRLSTTSSEPDFSDLSIPDAFGTTGTSVFGSLTAPTGKNVNYAVSIPDGIPVLANANMFSSWQQPVGGPSSIMETLQTTLNRLIVSAKFKLGLPTPLAFLVGFAVMFLFVLSSLFSVFLLWHMARKVVGRRTRGWRSPLRKEKTKTITNNGREFVIRLRPVTRITLRPSPKREILSPVSSRSSSSNSESPCPKRVRWVDEERGCSICAESCRVVDGDILGCGVDVEMEKVD